MFEASRAMRQRQRPSLRESRGLKVLVAAAVIFSGHIVLAAADEGPSREVKAYCASIAVAASDARVAWQTAKLVELETRIKARIQELDVRTAELRTWIEKREQMDKLGGEKLAGIYAKMRPETAATQISTLDDDMAAAILSQLNPRQASTIFNEIAPERAAKLAALIAAGPPTEKKQ